MRKTLLVVCLAVAACAKHAGDQIAVTKTSPQAPINQPDTSVQPAATPTTNDQQLLNGGSPAPETPSGGGTDPAVSGSTIGGSTGGSSGQSGPNPGGPPDTGPSGGPSGQPVPEPGTLLLVGTGLAGIALLRRRRAAPTA